MYPAQTSFIPVTAALARFAQEGGNVWANYPFWYLGTTPFRYLTGPVTPFLISTLGKVFNISLFEASFLTVGAALVFSSIGWGFFAWWLSQNRKIGYLVFVLTLLLPWHWAWGFGLGEVSAVLAGSMTPWVLFVFVKVKSLVISAVAFAVLLLTNTTASVPAVLGLIILGIIQSKHWDVGLKRVGIVVILGWFLTLWWYDPRFWTLILAAPSIGGKSAFGALFALVGQLRLFLPVVAAILISFWKIKPKTVFEKFSLGWGVLFASMTLFRFMADWDFWMDWTAWMGEVEVGVALLLSSVFVTRGPVRSFSFPASARKQLILLTLFSIYLVGSWMFAFSNLDFWFVQKSIENGVEYKIAMKLNEVVEPNETVFLSGSTAFWLNAFSDVRQVRGGRDEASKDQDWTEAAWEIREGEDVEKSIKVLKTLGIDYLVVHDQKSREFYHDFKKAQKFSDIGDLVKIYEDGGDWIYKINSVQSSK